MAVAQKAVAAKKLSNKAFEDLRVKFNKIHEWAMRHIGKAALKEGWKSLNPRTYQPPAVTKPKMVYKVESKSKDESGHLYPPESELESESDSKWRFIHAVPQESVDKVDAIKEKALGLGWTEAELYQNRGKFRFPMGPGWGLVCFVKGKRIGNVYEDKIELVGRPPRESVLCFRKSVSLPLRQGMQK